MKVNSLFITLVYNLCIDIKSLKRILAMTYDILMINNQNCFFIFQVLPRLWTVLWLECSVVLAGEVV